MHAITHLNERNIQPLAAIGISAVAGRLCAAIYDQESQYFQYLYGFHYVWNSLCLYFSKCIGSNDKGGTFNSFAIDRGWYLAIFPKIFYFSA